MLYADNTALFATGSNQTEIQKVLNEDLARVSKWLQENKLTLNATKTKCMLFGTAQKIGTVDEPLQVKHADVLLEQVNNFRYLGLNFDPCLNWNHHIKVIGKKLAQRTGILHRIRPFITAGAANTMCKALILPVMDYGNVIWSQTSAGNLLRLQRLQNRAGRIVLQCPKRTHICDVHERLQWNYCQTRSNINRCLMVAKCLMGCVPRYLDSIFKFVNDTHGRQTRAAETRTLRVPFPRNNSLKRTFRYAGAVSWNGLPQDLRMIKDYTDFKKRCKTFFTESLSQ